MRQSKHDEFRQCQSKKHVNTKVSVTELGKCGNKKKIQFLALCLINDVNLVNQMKEIMSRSNSEHGDVAACIDACESLVRTPSDTRMPRETSRIHMLQEQNNCCVTTWAKLKKMFSKMMNTIMIVIFQQYGDINKNWTS